MYQMRPVLDGFQTMEGLDASDGAGTGTEIGVGQAVHRDRVRSGVRTRPPPGPGLGEVVRGRYWEARRRAVLAREHAVGAPCVLAHRCIGEILRPAVRGGRRVRLAEAGGTVDKDTPTQVGRALAQLDRADAAYSPEARGRSERMFGTLQKRLPQNSLVTAASFRT